METGMVAADRPGSAGAVAGRGFDQPRAVQVNGRIGHPTSQLSTNGRASYRDTSLRPADATGEALIYVLVAKR